MIYRESKVYFDGSHYIAIPHTNRPPSNRRKPVEELIEVRQEQIGETVAQSTEPVRDEAKEVRTATAEPDFSDDDIFEEGCVYLTPETAPFPFAFDDEPQSDEQNSATVRMTRKDLFEKLYAQTADLPRKERKFAILSAMLPYFQDEFAAKMFVEENFNRKIRNLVARKIRLTRKANLQEFNYFCTVTYFYGQFFYLFVKEQSEKNVSVKRGATINKFKFYIYPKTELVKSSKEEKEE